MTRLILYILAHVGVTLMLICAALGGVALAVAWLPDMVPQ